MFIVINIDADIFYKNFYKKAMKFLHKIFFLLSLISLVACNFPKSYKTEKRTELRIVDLQGNPRPVQLKTPELNVQALAEQGNLTEKTLRNINKQTPVFDEQVAKNKYAAADSAPSYPDAIRDTLQTPTSPQATAQKTPLPDENVSAGTENKAPSVEYDLTTDSNDQSKKISKQKMSQQQEIVESETVVTGKKHAGIFVQAGSFSVISHAKHSLTKIEKSAGKKGVIEEVNVNNKTVYRVLIGPFTDKHKASAMVAKLDKSGHKAIIVRNK